jgi:signal transduction histidine kinase
MDELLANLVVALRDAFALDGAEVWLASGGVLTLSFSEPRRERAQASLTRAEESIVAGARVSGSAWVRMWLPELLDGRPQATLRVAPLSQSGRLLGLIVVQRAKQWRRLAVEVDVTLEELARELGFAINKASLDLALGESLDRLRRQAEDLRASRARVVSAADAERRRIERDLHDGAQQHLVALAIKARTVERLAERDPDHARTVSAELAEDVEKAIDELRDLAHGIYPTLLASSGLNAALAEAGRCGGIPVRVEMDGVGRAPAEIETAVYFCCVEALQNAAKHAGPGAVAGVRLWEETGALHFEVADDGAGFVPEEAVGGAGLANMSDRLGAVGGDVYVVSEPGRGTCVGGSVPLPPGLS